MVSLSSRKLSASLATALVGVFLLLSFSESRLKSPTSDEPPHMAAGLSYFVTHQIFRANPQHPPLLKELSALSMMMGGIRWPHSPQADYLVNGNDPSRVWGLDWPIGNEIIRSNGPDKVMFWARLPMILVAALLAVMLYFWGRQMVGPLAAVGAVFLYTLDPTILAHSFLVTTDIGMAAFTVLLLFSVWNYMLYPSWQRLLLCGLALGAVLTAKFSAVFLLPVAAFLLLAGVRWPPVPNSGRKQTLLDPYFSGKGSPAQNASGIQSSVSEQPAGRIGRKDRCPCGSGKKYKNCHGADSEESASLFARSGLGRKALLAMSAFAAMCLVAYVMIQAVYFFPSGPFLYAKCMRLVNADHNPAYLQFLAGELRNNSPSYFAVAYLLKEPIAGIILTGIGFVVLVRSKSIPFIAKLFLIVPPATLFVAVSALADNIGIRYIIPVFPFLYLLGGLGLATLIQAGTKIKWTRYAAIILCGWIVLAAAGVYPDHLPYFNEAACLLDKPGQIGLDGGTRCGPTWLDDSNVEWGEGLKQLKAWLDRNANGRTVKLAIFTSFPPDAYDIKYDRLEHSTLVKEPAPGLYAVSAHLVARMPAYPLASDWLRRIRPMAIVAHSLYIYDIPRTSTRH